MYVCVSLKLELHNIYVFENVTKTTKQKQQKIVFKTSLLWSYTSKKVEICASNNVSHFNWAILEKQAFLSEFGSKLHNSFSITRRNKIVLM